MIDALLSARGLRFAYGARRVLDGVSLAVHAGEVVALAGPNGAGKTTLLKVLAGLLAPDAGVVEAIEPRTRAIAYLAQAEALPPDFLVEDVVELGRIPHVGILRDLAAEDVQAVARAMERTETLRMAGRAIRSLSGGERQRVALARALAQEPRVLLLDEPAAYLDLRHQTELVRTLRAEAARGVAVVAVLHDLGLLAQVDRCVLLAEGAVHADGPPAQVLLPGLLRDVYGGEVEMPRYP